MFIIDVSNTLPQLQFGDVVALKQKNIDYIQRYLPRWINLVGWKPDEFQQRLKNNSLEMVLFQLFKELEECYSLEKLREILKASNIRYHAIHIIDNGRKMDEEPINHDIVGAILAKYPEEFLGFAGFNPHKKDSLKIVEKALTTQGYRAVVITPYDHGIPADDERYYPLYEICEKLEKPIWIQSSINYYKETSIFINHPMHLEEPLKTFSRLKIIAGHGGWPWMEDMVALLLKYRNLYVDSAAFNPQHIDISMSSLSLFFQYANTSLQDQILFSSNWLSKGLLIQELLEEVLEWPLNEEVKEKFFYKNALKLFQLVKQ